MKLDNMITEKKDLVKIIRQSIKSNNKLSNCLTKNKFTLKSILLKIKYLKINILLYIDIFHISNVQMKDDYKTVLRFSKKINTLEQYNKSINHAIELCSNKAA